MSGAPGVAGIPAVTSASSGSSFLDEWLAKRKQLSTAPASQTAAQAASIANPVTNTIDTTSNGQVLTAPLSIKEASQPVIPATGVVESDKLTLRGGDEVASNEVSVKIR